MESRNSIANAELGGGGADQPTTDEIALLVEGQERHEEAFEATIIRLDSAAAESLFRKAGL